MGWAVLSGILLGLAFPPTDWKLLAWIGLVPLFGAIASSRRPRTAFLYGYLAGLGFFLLTLHPLVSVHSWTGWAAESSDAYALRMSRQWWFMQGIWAGFAVWCAVWWGAWAVLIRRVAPAGGWRLLAAAPAAWLVLPEAVRAVTTFGFSWAFLGNAAADLPAIRQWAAVGGVALLSALIVAVNAAVALVLASPSGARRQRACVAAALLMAGAWAGGRALLLMPLSAEGAMIPAAALQHHKPAYHTSDFARTGLDRSYLPLVHQALQTGAKLIVLPESIALGTVSLDGSPSGAKPPEWQHARAAWDAQLAGLLRGTGSTVVIGLDTVEEGRDHNTLVAWTEHGIAGRYHKRRLVPFSEYHPAGWGRWVIRGRSQYSFGQGSQLITIDGTPVGGFICQEVLFPWVTRRSVRDGAQLLVSGGNDGVFSDPAVARVHADTAQLRAVEARRWIIRAMKTGISGIIDPYGREVQRSRSEEPVILRYTVHARSGLTPSVRWGLWPLWVALPVLLALALYGPKAARQP